MAEPELIRQAKAGSRAAFSELLAGYENRLYRFLLVRACTRGDAEDALQECFINAYRYINSYDSRWQFSTWLYRIALRELGKLPQPASVPLLDEQPDHSAADPLAQCIARDDRKNLWLLAREVLSTDAFNALWLRYAEDLSVSEVARAMGRPVTWVKVVVHRAKKRLAARHHADHAVSGRNTHGSEDEGETTIKCETAL